MATTPPTGFPQAFGKYRLLRKLARGGMAELFLATAADQRRPLVIKRVLPHFTQDTEFLKMFLNEARIAALLNHPGIVQVYDLGKEEEHLFIAMEFVDGFDLETLTKLCGGRLPPLIAARVGADVCDALYYANRVTDLEGKPLNIVHRDVTPGNVMITRRGDVKLVDFGVAKAAAQLERTRPGVVKGKFRYMSPEQVTFKELDGRTDLFSLGVLLYEVTTGERPFERKQIIDIIRSITDWTPPVPTEAVKGYPKALSVVVMKALEKDRDKRYRNAREMQVALDLALTKTPTGKAELANFIAELARAHPKELAPVAPEFSDPERPDPTDPMRQSRLAEVEKKEKPEGQRRTVSRLDGAAAPKGAVPVLRTEAIPGSEVKRMIEAADKRAAARASVQVPRAGGPPSNTRLPFAVGPPKEDEATVQGADDDDDEETTTNPVSPRPGFQRSNPSPRRPSRDGPVPPRPGDDGPATERGMHVHVPGDLDGGLGSDDDLDAPTVSNADGVPGVSGSRSAVSEVSVTAARRVARRRLLLVFTALCLLATLVFLILTLLARAPPETADHLKDGVKLGRQPLDKITGAAPGAGALEASDDDGGVAAEPAPGDPSGTVTVDGPAGIKVSVGGRPDQDLPAKFTLPPGQHKCFFVQRNKKKPCRTVTVENGKQSSIHVP